jgi:hypothetical protein
MSSRLARDLATLDPQRDADQCLTSRDEQVLASIMSQPCALERRPKRWQRPVLAVAAAAVVVGLTSTQIDVGGQKLGPSPAAAAVLQEAAAQLRHEPVRTKPGQYLRLRAHIYQLDEPHDFGWWDTYIPHDAAQPVIAARVQDPRNPNDIQWLFEMESAPDSYGPWHDATWFDGLPSEPSQLLDAVRRRIKASAPDFAGMPIERAFINVLGSPVAPAGIKAALLDGISQRYVLHKSRFTFAGDGSSHVAIRLDDSPNQLLFDPETRALSGAVFEDHAMLLEAAVVDELPKP